MNPAAALLPCGTRLHLQQGPIDLIIGADGARDVAFQAAQARFQTILIELVEELPKLRAPMSQNARPPTGETALRMHQAACPFARLGYLTCMAAVAGAVADTVLKAMTDAANLRRAYVNNGGDIALHLADGESYASGITGHDGYTLGHIQIQADDGVGGIATSGRHGRSLSRGIADSVTVLAPCAATADVAATLIANAVDLQDHPNVTRRPACDVIDDSDLGQLSVVVGCERLTRHDCHVALHAGLDRARGLARQGTIGAAALFLQGETMMTDTIMLSLHSRTLADA